jgi:hypothetical protein
MKLKHAKEIFQNIDTNDRKALKERYREIKSHLTKQIEQTNSQDQKHEISKQIQDLNRAFTNLFAKTEKYPISKKQSSAQRILYYVLLVVMLLKAIAHFAQFLQIIIISRNFYY